MEFTKKNIYNLFKKMGMPLGFKGMEYCCDLILELWENFHNSNKKDINLSKTYEKLSLRYNKDPKSIERATRYFIETGFNRIKPKIIEEIFGFTDWYNGYPPIKEFIYSVFNYMFYGSEENA